MAATSPPTSSPASSSSSATKNGRSAMQIDSQFAEVVVALLATYLLHSTLLLSGVSLALALSRSRSAALQETLWKLAALAPLLTAPLQIFTAERWGGRSVWTLPAIAFDDFVDADLRDGV